MARRSVVPHPNNPRGPRGATPNALPKTMEQAERDAIAHALNHFNGNRKNTADHLGIGLRTLYEKLKRYALD